jgi:hypothetical protein
MSKTIPGLTKDENGLATKEPRKALPSGKRQTTSDVSIDDLMAKGLKILHSIMMIIEDEVASQQISRDSVMNLKDSMNMLRELKKEEKEFLDSLSEEELNKLAKK